MLQTQRSRPSLSLLSALAALLLLSSPHLVHAGCGCDKAPPAPAQVRPHATYAGQDITIFDPQFQAGQAYFVTFTSGSTGEHVTVDVLATIRRDLADGQEKAQLVVSLPALPLGPTSLRVAVADSPRLLVADDSALTVVPPPIALSSEVGETVWSDFQAAVGRDGTVYVSLDLTGTHLPRTFEAHMHGYPLRFTNHDVVFFNTQGFVMQLLEEGMPGLYEIEVQHAADSTVLQYARHEFATHFLHHAERQDHALDPDDANWHRDGTPHIDHDHLIVAIAGDLADGSLPVPGATPAFDLAVHTFSLFHHGILGTDAVMIDNRAVVDSYHTETDTFGAHGHIHSNTQVTVQKHGFVDGDVMAPHIAVLDRATVTGELRPLTHPVTPMPVQIPAHLEDLGRIVLGVDETQTIVGPGSFRLTDLILTKNARLFIDNTAGPVTLYLTGQFNVIGYSQIQVTDPNPEKLAVYITGTQDTVLTGDSTFYGVIHAPASQLTMAGQGEYFGAFTGRQVALGAKARVHFDAALRGHAAESADPTPYSTGGDAVTSTDTMTSEDTTTQSSGPGNGKGPNK